MSIPRPRKIQIGDLVKLAEEAQVYKLHRHPVEVLNYISDLENPRLIYHDDKNVPPEYEQNYLVSDVRDLFDTFGYRKRICKIVGVIDCLDGWIPDKSLEVIAEGNDDVP